MSSADKDAAKPDFVMLCIAFFMLGPDRVCSALYNALYDALKQPRRTDGASPAQGALGGPPNRSSAAEQPDTYYIRLYYVLHYI